jgi:hypothetical protein
MSVPVDTMSESDVFRRVVIRHMSEQRPSCEEITDEEIRDIEMPWWLTDEFYGSDEAEYASWLRTLPDDIRADYELGPWTGAGESMAAGFLHDDHDGRRGEGFASGGYFDLLAPGLELAAATASNADRGHSELGESELIGALCAWQRLASWAQAGQVAAAMALMDRRNKQSRELRNPHLAEHLPDEVAAAMRLTNLSAQRLLCLTAGLKRLPAVLDALRKGEIDWPKACLFMDMVDLLDADVAAAIVAALLGRAGAMTTGQLRAALKRAILKADPAAAEQRKKEARKDTSVQFGFEASGNAMLSGRELSVRDAIHANLRLHALARWLQKHGATDTLEQLRAAVYIALLTGQSIDSLLPPSADKAAGKVGSRCRSGSEDAAGNDGARGCAGLTGWPAVTGGVDSAARRGGSDGLPQVTGTINLTMPMSAFTSQAESPGELASYGPLDAATCRDIAADADLRTHWCLTLTDQDGRTVAHACARAGPAPPGATTPAAGLRWAAGLAARLRILETGSCGHARRVKGYRPSPSLRHLIQIRQPTCSGPGCRRASVRCDLDHTTPYDQGGMTCECNLGPTCRRHHRAKQAPGWHLEQPEPGHMTWRLPSGRTYETVGDLY